ncbi:MAG TPA: aldehyde dehydrogenase family protein [Candidatus Binatia bacterium]|nr:aldehyde dehydrogenase family protein [Candidatus Binatia bacterium]
MEQEFAHLIGGELAPGSRQFPVVNPATAEPFAQCPDATPADVERAMAAAAGAFAGPWARDEALRRAALGRAADALGARADEIGRLVCLEQGKPLAAAVGEVKGAAAVFRLYAEEKIPVQVLREDAKARITLVRRPLGVTAAITPWNYPVYTLVQKLGPALLAGNTVVAKPSPFTPLSSLALGAALREVFPPGTLNVLGGGDEVGAWLTAHPTVRKISFTGSVPTGKKIARAAADDLKRVTLELGGNDPAIVLPDVDPAQVAPKLFWGAFTNSGQVCVAIKRLYVHEDVYRPLLAALTALAAQTKIGDGLAPDTQLGPINNRPQFERVCGLVEDAKRHGGHVAVGGAPLRRPGYFYPPTLVTDVGEGVRLVDEEQFGPALPVIPYRDLDDAFAQANHTHYGLGGSVWTADPARGEALAQRLECGTAWVNQHLSLSPRIPFGGVKWSGIGRENGPWGVDEFCELQVVNVAKA